MEIFSEFLAGLYQMLIGTILGVNIRYGISTRCGAVCKRNGNRGARLDIACGIVAIAAFYPVASRTAIDRIVAVAAAYGVDTRTSGGIGFGCCADL